MPEEEVRTFPETTGQEIPARSPEIEGGDPQIGSNGIR
jgi:hypothetical protein